MKILAIDPGYGRCGVAILERVNNKDILIHSDCIETSAKDEFPDRLATIMRECEALFNDHSPEQVILEKLFFKNNQKTAMHVAEVRGAIIAAAAMRNIPIHEYTPPQIKSAVAGHGGADKKQVIAMVHLLLPLTKKIKHDDEYDAIAVGLTHLAIARHR
jgi:crossover junction endodeoxyribonuclease RuvC